MREIKFRARLDKKSFPKSHSKGWVYGFVSKYKGDWSMDTYGNYGGFVANGSYLAIDPETIGQYTGLKDKNGKEIYETDIVKYKDYAKEHISKVIQNFRLGTGHYIKSPGIGFYSINERTIKDLEIEVIGNVFEDSHLLEEQYG